VSQVIAAIDWVVEHRTDHGLNIRVLNLSFATDGTQSYLLDALTYAIEVAWRHGIVVVVAAGNAGYGSGSLKNPAYDPYSIAVGASANNGTLSTEDDTVAPFSSAGDGLRNPDLLAPGQSIVSLRDPGSYIDQTYPGGRVGSRFFRGSGTSQAAAILSGAAALVLAQRPSITPDGLKALLTGTAQRLSNVASKDQGHGLVNLRAAFSAPTPLLPQVYAPATGLGSIEGSRGSAHLSMNGVVLQGERDIFGAPWVAKSWVMAALAGTTWNGGTWNGNRWSGSTWSGNTWSGSTWSGNTWSGNTWSGNTWSGNTWSGNTWSANAWT
jgi:serine protease AprX